MWLRADYQIKPMFLNGRVAVQSGNALQFQDGLKLYDSVSVSALFRLSEMQTWQTFIDDEMEGGCAEADIPIYDGWGKRGLPCKIDVATIKKERIGTHLMRWSATLIVRNRVTETSAELDDIISTGVDA